MLAATSGPLPGDLVVRDNRWILAAHVIGIVIYRNGNDATVWWSPTQWVGITVLHHLAAALVVVDDSSIENLKTRCMLAP